MTTTYRNVQNKGAPFNHDTLSCPPTVSEKEELYGTHASVSHKRGLMAFDHICTGASMQHKLVRKMSRQEILCQMDLACIVLGYLV